MNASDPAFDRTSAYIVAPLIKNREAAYAPKLPVIPVNKIVLGNSHPSRGLI
jgi:hypothetical protein